MTQGYQQLTLKIFEGRQIRTAWNPDNEKYYFSIVDIIQVLTDSVDATVYWQTTTYRCQYTNQSMEWYDHRRI